MQKENKLLYLVGKVAKLLYYIVITLICVIAFFLVIYIVASNLNANKEDYKPKLSIYTIVSPSMTPVINVYDVIINIRPNNENDIQVGDIITYKSEVPASQGMMITHRVIEIETKVDGTKEYTTQGDSNSEPDSMPVTYNQVIGKEILIIPCLGKIQFLIANKKGWLLLCLIPIFFFIIKDIGKIIKLFQLRKKVTKVTSNEDFTLIHEQEQLRKENILHSLIEKEEAKKEIIENQVEQLKNGQEEQENEEENKIEVLDTDELTKIIKEYDKKIEELEQMLKNVEQKPIAEKNEEPKIEEEDFLKEKKIKVIHTELTKNQKREIPVKENKQYVDKTPIKPILNNKIEQTITTPRKKKTTLNLKSNQVTKIATKKKETFNKNRFIHIEKTKK